VSQASPGSQWLSEAVPDLRSLVDRPWLVLLGATAFLVEMTAYLRTVIGHDRPPMTPDAAIFQHAGWYMTRGGALYLDVWEPKPPLSYETTALLALVSGGNMALYHLLNVGLMLGLAAGTVVLVGLLADRLTADPLASTVAGLSLFLLPGFALRPALGYKAKYALLFAGLLAIYLALEDRPFAAGVAAAAAVGYWQLSLVFPLVALGIAWGDRRAVARLVAGGAALSAAMLAPVVSTGGSTAMLVQAVVVPLSLSEHTPLLVRIYAGAVHFRWAAPLVVVGGAGLLWLARDWRETWWALAPAGWFALIVLFVDFEVGGYTDLIPGLAFLALGVAAVVDRLREMGRPRARRALVGAVGAVVVFNVVALGGTGVVFDPVDAPEPTPMPDLAENSDENVAASPYAGDVPDVRHLYWNAVEPADCHYRYSLMELDWLAHTGGRDACRGGDAAELLGEMVH
jgi:hypothetical protein